MKKSTLVKHSLGHYWRSNLAVICGVATAVAVLGGALLVGDSVRASLRQLAINRLGETDHAIIAQGFFREQLAGDLEADAELSKVFSRVMPLIAFEGVVTHDESKRRAGGVQVYGIDERFFEFHRRPQVAPPTGNEVLLSPGLAADIGAAVDDQILLRIEKTSEIPVESLHSRKEDLGVTMRATVRATLDRNDLGEFSLRPQQSAVKAIFVPLGRMQRVLEQDEKANVLLLARRDGAATGAQATATIQQALRNKYELADLGLKLRALPAGAIVLESDSALINDSLAQKARASAAATGLRASPVLTYLANTMRIGERAIPYSLVTALEPGDYARMKGSQAASEHPLLLNSWAASDLGAKPGDRIELEYYVWREEGLLETARAEFTVDGVVPLAGAAVDRDYAPEYPGISGAENLADWDPPFPVDLSRVRPKDEDYWHEYRTTPKAFLLLEDGARLWQTRYGRLTSVRLYPERSAEQGLEATQEAFGKHLREAIDPAAEGLQAISIREENLTASRGATDFGEYFTYFSFFIVASALLLAALFFRLGIEQRLREIGLLRATGFPPAEVRRLFLAEGALLSILGSLIGIAGALGYGALMMWGLRSWWVGAVGTTALELHVSPVSLIIGAVSGVLVSLLCIIWTLRGVARASPRSLLTGSVESAEGSRKRGIAGARLMAIVCGVAGLALFAAALLKVIGEVAGFFGAGFLLLLAALSIFSLWLRGRRRSVIAGQGLWPLLRLGMRNATFRPGRSVLCMALIGAATFIIIAVDAFRRDSAVTSLDRRSGTGGYALVAESLLPLVHDPNAEQGRENLNLGGEEEALAGVNITRFRLRPGDDASCLNLYQPRNPRILGATSDFLRSNRFSFQGSIAENDAERANPWLILEREFEKGVVPVIADANSLTYVLHLGLGDEMVIGDDASEAVRLRVVGALADSVLQGEMITSERYFLRHFPSREGYRYFLIDAPAERTEQVSTLLEDRLSDFGFDATTTGAKLESFHQVENTYLSTFQTLGGLGLLLGTFGLGAVLVRNVIERRRELALLRAVGYEPSTFTVMVVAENALLLLCGLMAGFVCALVAITPALVARGGGVPARSLLLLAAVMVTGLAASFLAVRAARRTALLEALRTE